MPPPQKSVTSYFCIHSRASVAISVCKISIIPAKNTILFFFRYLGPLLLWLQFYTTVSSVISEAMPKPSSQYLCSVRANFSCGKITSMRCLILLKILNKRFYPIFNYWVTVVLLHILNFFLQQLLYILWNYIAFVTSKIAPLSLKQSLIKLNLTTPESTAWPKPAFPAITTVRDINGIERDNCHGWMRLHFSTGLCNHTRDSGNSPSSSQS